ncbi:hypothetical protein DFH09DRAFT_1405340, partial [Mycena vulgaris]
VQSQRNISHRPCLRPNFQHHEQKVLLGVFVLTMVAYIVHYASLMRLTRILVAAIADAERIYLEALEAGVLSKSDTRTAETLARLQIKISTISEASLHNSLSYHVVLCKFLKGRTLTVLECLRKILRLETDIEGEWLPDLDKNIGAGAAMRMVSLRR